MKNSNRILISTMVFAIGAALAGSVSGTIAWYQYSTRAKVQYRGTSFGTTGNLKIRISGKTKWETVLTKDDVANYLIQEGQANHLEPITTGPLAKDAALPNPVIFYKNPHYRVGPYNKWVKADKTNYVSIPLEMCFTSNEEDEAAYSPEKVYMTDLTIKKDKEATEDISNAVRVHISGDQNFLVSKNGETVVTHANLDLNDDGEPDTAYPEADIYGFDSETTEEIVNYGGTEGEQTSYTVDDLVVDSDPDTMKFTNATDAKCIGSTVASKTSYLNVNVTIWVEGWEKLENNESLWDVKYIDQLFDVGIQFGVDAK